MRTANPALKPETFRNLVHANEEVMTLQGTVNKTFLALAALFLTASWIWNMRYNGTAPGPLILLGIIGSFIVAIVTCFNKQWAPYTTLPYAMLEGLALGGISLMFESMYPGIVIQAVFLTFGVLTGLLLAYQTKLIQATENFKLGVAAATFGICFYYILSFIFSFFGIQFPLIHSNGPMGIAFSVFVVIIAALNLVMDFDFIEEGVENQAPKYMEWYATFGLLVTLVWLYIEILRLLAKLRSRD